VAKILLGQTVIFYAPTLLNLRAADEAMLKKLHKKSKKDFAFLKGYGFSKKFGVVLLLKFIRNHSKY
jgi:hypothetical protein